MIWPSTTLILVSAIGASADFEKFWFPNGPARDPTLPIPACSKSGFSCVPPAICTYEANLNRTYCCDSGEQGAVCWNADSECDGDDGPSGDQIGCGKDRDKNYCCLRSSETCKGNINICSVDLPNPFENVPKEKMNATYSSLSSRDPSFTSWMVDYQALTMTSTPVDSSTASSTHSSSSDTSSASTTPTTGTSEPSPGSSEKLSGGAIGGIVVGAIAGLALLGIGAFFLMKRRTSKKAKEGTIESSNDRKTHDKYIVTSDKGQNGSNMGTAPVEMPSTNTHPVEVEGSTPLYEK